MKELFAAYGIDAGEKSEKQFARYHKLLVEYNKRYNLTAITDEKEVYVKHFIDSLLCIGEINSGNLVDIGSGGGFPALPIAIMRDDIFVTMIEATRKKCDFLGVVIDELNLKNASVLNMRAEDAAKMQAYREKFDIATARAVAPLNVLVEYALPLVRVGGTFIAFKGNADNEVPMALNAVKILGGDSGKVDKKILDGARRDIIFINKISPTPAKYPRGNGKERKYPL